MDEHNSSSFYRAPISPGSILESYQADPTSFESISDRGAVFPRPLDWKWTVKARAQEYFSWTPFQG